MPSGLVILGVVCFALVLAWGFYASAQRRKALIAWAQAHGLTFRASRQRSLQERWPDFKCFHQGHSRYAYNLIEGDWEDAAFLGFDFHYTTGSGKNRSDHHFSAVVLSSPVPLKPLYLRREGLFDKVTEFFGLDDIDFESAEFSRTFYVKSPDKRWAYDVIHQRMMEYLLEAPQFSVQFGEGQVIAWRDRCFDPDDFGEAARFIRGIFDRLPDYVLRQQSDGA
jgi:hypothetical protein